MVEKVAVTQADRVAAARIRSIYTRRVDGQSRAEGNVAAHAAATELAAEEAARYRIATAEACARIAEEREAKLRRQITDASYMLTAYRQMLGPKGRQVADMWEAQGVLRQHTSWGPGAAQLSGEEIAQAHLDFEVAPRQRIDNVDSHLAQEPAIRLQQGSEKP